MGRRRKGPYRQGGDTYYVRLIVPPKLRSLAGKTCLTRSLKTSDHSTALKRYGAAYEALERELQQLLKPASKREAIEAGHEQEVRPGDPALTPLELMEIQQGSVDLANLDQTSAAVFDYYSKGVQLPITWDEALDIWIKERNRSNARPLSDGTIKHAKSHISFIKDYGSPQSLTKTSIRQFISDQEESKASNTVASYLKTLGAIAQVLVQLDYLEINLFKSISYTVSKRSSRRSFTDEEIRFIHDKLPPCFLLTTLGLRTSELENGIIEDDIMIITDTPKFRPKTLSSYRRVPLPKGFTRPKTKAITWREHFRKHITDETVTLHSGRHTFIELSRRADCEPRVIEELCGHGSSVGSSSHKAYGSFTDEVLRREITKVWSLIDSIVNA